MTPAAPPPPRRGLGRGLGSLIPTGPPVEPEPAARRRSRRSTGGEHVLRRARPGPPRGRAPELVGGSYFTELPPASITPNPVQPRQVFDEEAMTELVTSHQGGRAAAADRGPPRWATSSFELVMGERRWRASQQAGLDRRSRPSSAQTGDDDMLRDALLENLHRSQLNPLEEAAAYGQLLEDFGCTHEELASRIGRSRPQISNTLRLLKLSPAVQRRVAAGVLSAGHARSLLAIEDPELQDRLAGRVVSEGISVRGLEEIVAVGRRRRRGPAPGGPSRSPRGWPTSPSGSRTGSRPGSRSHLGKSKGKDHRGVRLAAGPAADRRRDGPAQPDRPADLTTCRHSDSRFVDKATCRLSAPCGRVDARSAPRRSAASSSAASARVGALPPWRLREPPRPGRLLLGRVVAIVRSSIDAHHGVQLGGLGHRVGAGRVQRLADRDRRWSSRARSRAGGPWSSAAACPTAPPAPAGRRPRPRSGPPRS